MEIIKGNADIAETGWEPPHREPERPVLPVVEHDGDRWRVVATGTTSGDGYVYCHLASTTRYVQQRNGRRPVQIAAWIAADALRAGGAA